MSVVQKNFSISNLQLKGIYSCIKLFTCARVYLTGFVIFEGGDSLFILAPVGPRLSSLKKCIFAALLLSSTLLTKWNLFEFRPDVSKSNSMRLASNNYCPYKR